MMMIDDMCCCNTAAMYLIRILERLVDKCHFV